MKSPIKFSPFLIACICLLVFSSATAREKNEAIYEENFKLYRQLESNSEKAKRPETWDLVGSTFYRIYSQNPDWKNSPLCLFVAARVYEKKSLRFKSPEDTEKALQYSREFVKVYPDDSLTDDSWLRVGRIHERRGEKKEAAAAYQRIVYGMEDSDTYEIAKKKLAIVTGAPTPKKGRARATRRNHPHAEPERLRHNKKDKALVNGRLHACRDRDRQGRQVHIQNAPSRPRTQNPSPPLRGS